MRFFALLCSLGLFVSGCGSDKFVGGDAGSEGGTGCGHELCDNFDTPGEIAGASPWTSRNGPLSIVANGASKPSCLEAAATLRTYVTWALPKANGIVCNANVWLEPAENRGRTIAVFEFDVAGDGGNTTIAWTVTVDSQHVTGLYGQTGSLNSWGQSGTSPPTSAWLPFHFELAVNGQIAAAVGPAMLSGTPMIPGKILSARMSFGAANLDPMHMDIVRWDDITCDSK